MRVVAVLVALLLVPTVVAHHGSAREEAGLPPFVANSPTSDNLVHRVTDVQMSFELWNAERPDVVDIQTIGESGVLGLPLWNIRITDESIPFDEADTATGQKVRIYIDGGHHGNEFLGTDLPMYYLESLLRDTTEDTALWLQTHELWATPLVNPEGNALDTRKSGKQVDLNRNYPFDFGGASTSDNPAMLNYHGEGPLSEPESRANAEFAQSIMPDVWITGHSGISQFLYPWGWITERSPDDAFFKSMEPAFENATNGQIDMLMSAELYPAGGATDDWGYGQLGIPTHTYEVDDDQFIPAYGEGVPAQIENQLGGLDFVVKNARLWGAWLSMHDLDGELHVWNEGWAQAANVTLRLGDEEVLIPEIAPGEMVTFPYAGQAAVVEYKQMLVDAPDAKTRTVSYQNEALASAESDDAEASNLSVLVTIGLLAVALYVRRR